MKLKALFILTVTVALALSVVSFTPVLAQQYQQLAKISLPNVPPQKGSFSYDIGWSTLKLTGTIWPTAPTKGSISSIPQATHTFRPSLRGSSKDSLAAQIRPGPTGSLWCPPTISCGPAMPTAW